MSKKNKKKIAADAAIYSAERSGKLNKNAMKTLKAARYAGETFASIDSDKFAPSFSIILGEAKRRLKRTGRKVKTYFKRKTATAIATTIGTIGGIVVAALPFVPVIGKVIAVGVALASTVVSAVEVSTIDVDDEYDYNYYVDDLDDDTDDDFEDDEDYHADDESEEDVEDESDDESEEDIDSRFEKAVIEINNAVEILESEDYEDEGDYDNNSVDPEVVNADMRTDSVEVREAHEALANYHDSIKNMQNLVGRFMRKGYT